MALGRLRSRPVVVAAPSPSVLFNDAKNVVSFVDGHAGLTRIYWDGVSDSDPGAYDPPAGYDYNWDGD